MTGSGDIDVSLRAVTVLYQGRRAVEDVTFDVARGAFCGIIGPNGSGKTTLVKTILGLLRPFAGEVRVFGLAPDELGAQRARIGYVPQQTRIDFDFPLRVSDVVATGLFGSMGLGRRQRPVHHEAVATALERLRISDLAHRPIGELSGGQRQRALIARALVQKPSLLILDEPTAALDHSAMEGLYEWLHQVNEEDRLTILLVSHDMGVVSRYVDSIACMNTRLVAHGRPADMFTGETLEQMYGCGAVLFGHGEMPHMVVGDEGHRHSHGASGSDGGAA